MFLFTMACEVLLESNLNAVYSLEAYLKLLLSIFVLIP